MPKKQHHRRAKKEAPRAALIGGAVVTGVRATGLGSGNLGYKGLYDLGYPGKLTLANATANARNIVKNNQGAALAVAAPVAIGAAASFAADRWMPRVQRWLSKHLHAKL